jgi:alpha-glucosidase
MKHLIKSLFFVITTVILFVACSKEITVKSPNEKLQLTFELIDGTPYYSLSHQNHPVITRSGLGFVFEGNDELSGNFKLVDTQKNSVSMEWEQPWGEFKYVVDNHNEMIVHLQEKSGKNRLMKLSFRLFNDGLGFRYTFPKQPNLDSVQIMDELTEFSFPEEHKVWWTPVHAENSFYESLYRLSPVGETDTINTPATFETSQGLYLAIHEANLTNYASMTLKMVSEKQYISELVPWSNGVKVYSKAPFVTPWRTIIVAEKPGDLLTSTMMLNLNEPCALEDISWIEPSKYVGIWWGMHLEKYTWSQGPKHGATTENTIKYIDFAHANGFNGVLVEGWNYGWDGKWYEDGNNFSFTESVPAFDLEKISAYAAAKNVRLIGHHETGGAVSNYEKQMEDAFELYHKNGINAVKTGYVNKYLDGKEWHDGQFGVNHYRKVIETAAKYQIMIDNHEPVKGTGLQRTFPNLMTQEGGRGQEYDAWSADGGNPPSHTTILPFTRMLAGPFDFTPGTFNFDYKVVGKTRVQTTLAKQLALYVVIFSPQQMASDLPENYEENPAFQFIKEVPCIWADTKILNAEIGNFVTIARKDWDSENWYIGSITNEEKRNLNIQLHFLDDGKKYKATIYEDGEFADYQTNPYTVNIKSSVVSNSETIDLKLAPGGGTAVKLEPLGQ